MKHLHWFLIWICAGSISAQSLPVEVSMSEPFTSKVNKTFLLDAREDDEGNLIVLRQGHKPLTNYGMFLFIDHYDQNVKRIKSEMLEFNKTVIMDLRLNEGQVQIFAFEMVGKAWNVFVLQSELSHFDFQKKIIISKDKGDLENIFKSFQFMPGLRRSEDMMNMAFSKNEDFLCVEFNIKDQEYDTDQIIVFDKELDIYFETELVSEEKDKYVDVVGLEVDDEGTVYFMRRVFQNRSRSFRKGKEVNVIYELHRIQKDGHDKLTIRTENKVMSDPMMLIDEKRLVMGGFYSDEEEDVIHGAGRIDVDLQNFEIIQKSFLPFPQKMIQDLFEKKKVEELKEFHLLNFFSMSNGDMVLVGHQIDLPTKINSGIRDEVVLRDLIAVEINKEHEMVWGRAIHLHQAVLPAYDDLLSFFTTVVNDDTYFIFYSDEKVKLLKHGSPEFKYRNMWNSHIYLSRLDENGKHEYEKIIDTDDAGFYFPLRNGVRLSRSGNDILFLGREGAEQQFLRLKLLPR